MKKLSLVNTFFTPNSLLLGVGFLVILGLAMMTGYYNLIRITKISEQLDTIGDEYSRKVQTIDGLQHSVTKRITILKQLLENNDITVKNKLLSELNDEIAYERRSIENLRREGLLSKREKTLIDQIDQGVHLMHLADQNLVYQLDAAQESSLDHDVVQTWMPMQTQLLEHIVRLGNTYQQAINQSRGEGKRAVEQTVGTQLPLLLSILFVGLGIAVYVMFRNAQAERVIREDRANLAIRVQEHLGEINEQKKQLTVTFNSIADGVLTTDIYGFIKYMNPAAEKLTAFSLGDAVGKNMSEVIRIRDDFVLESMQQTQEMMHPAIAKRSQNKNKRLSRMIRRDGEERTIEESIAEMRDEDGKLTGYVVVVRDVSERVELEQTLSRQATHDELTGLKNRVEFRYQLDMILRELRQGLPDDSAPNHLLCFMDLDRFKVVNDKAGHSAGDEILRQVAQLLSANVRSHDTIARMGGDEFAFILRNCGLPDGLRVMDGIVKKIEQTRFLFGKDAFALGASVGIVALTAEHDSAIALSQADTACYSAKESGRRPVSVYRRNSVEIAKQRGQIKWLSRVQQALDDGNFELFYQPIERTVRQHNGLGSLSHFELLLRMPDGDGGYYMPNEFLPAATRYGLMPSIDRWVVAHAIEWCSQHQNLLNRVKVAINIDGSSLCDGEFLQYVKNCFDSHALDHGRVIFELTENSVIANMHEALKFIDQMREYGCEFALDDFGTGMSSFDYLKSLPVDYLKIDGSFIRDIVSDSIDEEVVRSINAIGQAMQKYTIAEYVESEEIRETLTNIGVNFVQGYAIARPMPLQEMTSVAA